MKELLPEISSSEIIVRIEDQELRKFLENCQNFALYINKEAPEEKLIPHHENNNLKYLSISYMQSMLDTLFFGLWKETNFRWHQINDELTASIDISVYHPYFKHWLTRTGLGAIQFIPGELAKGNFAALKAVCFKNACISLGKLFGRDVNREFTHNMVAVVPKSEDITVIRKEVSKALVNVKPKSKQEELKMYIIEVEENGGNNKQFYESILKTI